MNFCLKRLEYVFSNPKAKQRLSWHQGLIIFPPSKKVARVIFIKLLGICVEQNKLLKRRQRLHEARLDFESRLARLEQTRRAKGSLRDPIFHYSLSSRTSVNPSQRNETLLLMAFREACGNHIEEWLCEWTINKSAYQFHCTGKKHCSVIEKLQGLKMSVLGTSSGVVLCFSAFPWSMCKEAKADSYNKLYPHTHAYI